MAENRPKSTTVVLTREKFNAIPDFRAVYIGLYVLIFLVWAIATFSGLYYERVEVPVEPRGELVESEAAGDAAVAETEPQTRIEYRWKWTTGVQIFQAMMIMAMILFYIYFTRVLALMGYPLPMILGYCAAVFLPIPGLLAVALVDRQVAKTWNQAEDVFREAEKADRKPTAE